MNRAAKQTAVGLLGCITLGFAAGSSIGATISWPLGAADLQSLSSSAPPPASYGPPPPVSFYEPGPLTVNSGDSSLLYAGPTPGQRGIESVLFVFSTDTMPLTDMSFILNVGSQTLSAYFSAGDFLSSADCGFGKIRGIGNGEVNGIVFPEAYHAAARVWLDLGVLTGTELGSMAVMTPYDLRVDIFGVAELPASTLAPTAGLNGKKRSGSPTEPPSATTFRIVNNTPNSGAIGYNGINNSRIPDGGVTVLLLGGAIMALGAMKRFRLS